MKEASQLRNSVAYSVQHIHTTKISNTGPIARDRKSVV